MTSDDGEDCTMEELLDVYSTVTRNFFAFFEALRDQEHLLARRVLGHAADDPLFLTAGTIERLHLCLKNDTVAKLQTFGYRWAGPCRMKYWLKTHRHMPDLTLHDGCVDLEKLPAALLNHVYINYVYPKGRHTSTKRSNRPRLKGRHRRHMTTLN